MKRILVPTDFSDTAQAAFRPAVELARSYGATITVLYVLDRLTYNTGYPYLDTTAYQTRLEQTAGEALKRAAERVRELGAPDVEALYHVGTPHIEILREAKRGDYDIVMLATHGHSGFRRFILGSTAERVVRKAECAVMTVHASEPASGLTIRRMLLPTDLSSTGEEALPVAAGMARHFDAELEIFHVFEDPSSVQPLGPGYLLPSSEEVRAFREKCVNRLEKLTASLKEKDNVKAGYRISEETQPAEAIVDHATRGGFDLIVTPSHGRRGLEHMFLGSVSERVVRLAEVPVLVVKPSQFEMPDLEHNAGEE